jgi:EmrB/QacA subfamily drug resistance transporter
VVDAAPRPPSPEQTDEPDPRRWRALTVCLVGGFMVLLDVSIVNVALPSIRSGLDAGQSELQWVVSGYALTFGLVLVPAGRLGDVVGRRSTFIIGLALFTLASAACGAAQSAIWLVIARLVQGAAGGLVTPQITASIQQLFRGPERGKAFGAFGSVNGISTAVGPLLGGLLITAFGTAEGWRWVFYVNLPIGLVAMPLAWRLLPGRPEGERTHHDFDPIGVLLLGSGVVSLLLPFVQEQEWTGWAKWLLLPLALLLLLGFVGWERHYQRTGKEPVVDLGLFAHRSFSFGSSMIAAYFAGFTPLFFVFTLYLQTGLHYTALLAGVAITPFALGSALAAAIGGRLVGRFGRPLIAVGLVLVVIGFLGSVIAVHEVPAHGTGWATLAPLLLAGIGGGLVIAPNQTLTLSRVPVAQAGTAGGLLQTGQRIGAAVGIAAVGSVFFAQVAAGGGAGSAPYATGYEHGVLVATAFVAAALLITLAEIVVGRRRPAEPNG